MGPWQGYEDWKTSMKLYLTAHNEESMRERDEYKRVHGFLLRQWRDHMRAQPSTAVAKEATAIYDDAKANVEASLAPGIGGPAGVSRNSCSGRSC